MGEKELILKQFIPIRSGWNEYVTPEKEEAIEEEIGRLTTGLHSQWLELKELLSKEIELNGALLCTYYVEEKGKEYGVVVTASKDIYTFKIRNGKLKIKKAGDPFKVRETTNVAIALRMLEKDD